MNRTSTSLRLESDTTRWRSLDSLLLMVLALVSVYNFVRRGPTAFEWPGTDMAVFYERQQDPTFLPNDYYTNSIAKPNPRHVFGYLVLGTARLFGADWYSVYFALRVIQTLAVPMLWYLAMLGLIRKQLTDERRQFIARIAVATAMVLVMRRDVSGWFSIAWWPPYFQYVGAHPFAILLGLVGIVMRTHIAGPARNLALFIWFAATLIHPAIGLFMVAFYLLSEFNDLAWREMAAVAGIGAVAPIAVLTVWFRPETPLSAAEFVNLYVLSSHPFHYRVSEFATLTKHPWWVSFALVLLLMLGTAAIGLVRGNRQLFKLATLFAGSYAGCVVLQYLGTDVFPSKAIASLGPSRFSFLGYYMVAMLAALTFCDSERVRLHMLRSSWQRGQVWLGRLRPVYIALACSVAAIAMFSLLKDDLQQEVRRKYAGLYDWIERNTAEDAIFLPTFNHALHKQLPVIGRRALFASQTFPFREEAIGEHIKRLTLAYGTLDQLAAMPGRDQIAKRTNYFRSLTPAEVARMAERSRLDYIVVEREHQKPFAGYSACYEDASVAVYAVRDFAALADTPRRNERHTEAAARSDRRSTLQ